MKLKQQNPAIFKENSKICRNEGARLGTGQKLWKRAKRVIPGGNMLLSKRAEMFLPDQWPAYFSKAKGCHVWDLDGRKYVDMSIMGIGTNILGYGHPAVDEAVRQVIRKGNMSTLNCPEEVYLAEKLIELHPWAEMVRFARTGGEANAIAIRIARAATGKEKVAVCGYHGWHDWYLSANLADDHNLDGHLLPGLEPKGVPRNLKGTVFPFRYNQYEELENLVKQEGVGIVKMEVERNESPKPGYLQKIRKLCSDRGIVLIFDECTSGFRETFGGLHKKYGVEPDMAMFGKALGNGYAITAVIGRRNIMEAAQSTFISSTFWTERIGPTAALKTLEVMEKERAWERITSVGKEITFRWLDMAKQHGLGLKTFGLPALASFSFRSVHHQAYRTLITQEMLKEGYLAAASIYVCLAHTGVLRDRYFQILDGVFAKIAACEGGLDPESLLHGPLAETGFRRLN
jgi:glutamate-1-semialdehyde 2,1-aminomutase